MISRLVFVLIALVGFATPGFAKSIVVEKAWAEAMEGVADRGDVFLVVKNNGSSKDRLYAVKTKIAKKASLEAKAESEVQAGHEKEVLGLDVAAGKSLVLSEDGPHIEMLGLKEKLISGSTFQITLFFEEAGAIKVDVKVGE